MGNRLKYLLKNTSIFAIGEIGTKLINFFLVPFYTHILSTEQYGTVDLIFTISTVLVPLVMLNIGEAIMRYALDEDSDQDKIFSIAFITIIVGSLVSVLIIPISQYFDVISEYSIFLFAYIVLCATKSVLTSFLRGREQLKLYVSCNLLNTFLIAILNIVFLVNLHLGIKGYLMAYILAEAIAIIYAFIVGKMYRQLNKITFDSKLAKQMISFSLAVIPNSLLWWVINSSDRVMVTSLCDVSENGILAVGYKIPSLLTMINTILMQAWKYSAIKEKDSKDKDEFNNAMLRQYFYGSVLVSACLIFVLKILTSMLYEESYYNSWKPGVFLVLGFVFMGLSTFVGTVYYVKKDMIGNMISALVGAIVNIILNFIFIPQMGAAGATFAACCSYFVILIYRYFDTKKYQRLTLFKLNFVLNIFCLVAMVIAQLIGGTIGLVFLIVILIAMIYLNKNYIQSTMVRCFNLVKNMKIK